MPRYIDAEVMPKDEFWYDLSDREKQKVLQWLISAPTADAVLDHKWIRVEDRLPKNMKDVLVWTKYSGAVVCFFDKNEGVWIHNTGVYEKDDVTHWKPISPPPKGE